MSVEKILIDGQWIAANRNSMFKAIDPNNKQIFGSNYPVSTWVDADKALNAATQAAAKLRNIEYGRITTFLKGYAARIEADRNEIVSIAHAETGLPKNPRLEKVELPRTTDQLRKAADVAEKTWQEPEIHVHEDDDINIRSCYEPIGPVAVFGPNNFPLAFNSASGSDFAGAIRTRNPVIIKGHPSHPNTTKALVERAYDEATKAGLPPGTIQLIYHLETANGLSLVSDPRIGATAYTGSRTNGLKLKEAADNAGRPIYLELSSTNPVVILPGALTERGPKIAGDLATSVSMGSGQFCSRPGLVIPVGSQADTFIRSLKTSMDQLPVGTLLSEQVQTAAVAATERLKSYGAVSIARTGTDLSADRYCLPHTILTVDGATFLSESSGLQTDVFANAVLCVKATDLEQARQIVSRLEGNLTGTIYSDTTGEDDESYNAIQAILRLKVGRLLDDKMPTGVKVSPGMNHGGPFPATGHPGFTAIGFPRSLRRFTQLACYDNVRPHRLPLCLQG